MEQERRLPILVTGGSGMLGSYFSGPRFFKPSRQELDLCLADSIPEFFATQKFSGVLHLAAMTNLDFCERNPQLAWAINAESTEHLAKICAVQNIPLLYLSTAGIFGGVDPHAFSEEESPKPVSVYAKSKYAGELAVQKFCPKHYIIRIGWLMGGGKRDHKFIGTINHLMKSINEPQTIPIVTDTRGSLLYGKDLPDCLWQILRKKVPYGTYHVSNSGVCSRMEIARALRDLHGLNDHQIDFKPVYSSAFPTIAPRPACEVLLNQKLPRLGFAELRHWRTALSEYFKELMEE